MCTHLEVGVDVPRGRGATLLPSTTKTVLRLSRPFGQNTTFIGNGQVAPLDFESNSHWMQYCVNAVWGPPETPFCGSTLKNHRQGRHGSEQMLLISEDDDDDDDSALLVFLQAQKNSASQSTYIATTNTRDTRERYQDRSICLGLAQNRKGFSGCCPQLLWGAGNLRGRPPFPS